MLRHRSFHEVRAFQTQDPKSLSSVEIFSNVLHLDIFFTDFHLKPDPSPLIANTSVMGICGYLRISYLDWTIVERYRHWLSMSDEYNMKLLRIHRYDLIVKVDVRRQWDPSTHPQLTSLIFS